MRKALIATIVLGLTFVSLAAAAGPELTTEDQKTIYALGLAISQSLASFKLSAAELELLQAGLADGVLAREPKIVLETYGPKIADLQHARIAAASQPFLDRAAAEKGATKTASGLIITTLKDGAGAAPVATDQVKVHYTGAFDDGSVFDSSLERGEPATLDLGRVIPCWREGLMLMKVGGKSKLVCPAGLAYGDRGIPNRIKPGATLVFEVELLEIVK
jgi:FKBP-type peptidyl-prolyl cis-trans isomerase FkpA/FKBP-type peptidyl-prolyl cis-trans isomerase FklB